MVQDLKNGNSRAISAHVAIFFVVLWTALIGSFPLTADAQSNADRTKVTAVMAVINNYLLNTREEPIARPDGRGVTLTLNQVSPDTYTVDSTEQFYAEFELQQAAVELCFNLDSNNPVNPSQSLVIEVNGERRSAVMGENCFVLNDLAQRLQNYVTIRVVTPGIQLTLTTLELAPTNQTRLGLPSTTRSNWDERAVRKVLNVFAFGGHATDAQIFEWADMRPNLAIAEMLNFSQHNLKLSPLAPGERYTEVASAHGTVEAFYGHIESTSSDQPIPVSEREYLGLDGYRFDSTFARMIAMRGLNPFRQRIGFWETNYHLATNRDAGVSRRQMVRYYDEIMAAHEARLPYHEVIGVAAKSAAVAMQYGHRRNRWVFEDGEWMCECNFDFAREIHQLFYGIFGENDPNHEDGTIVETGKMLTDMRVPYISDFGFDLEVTFESDYHHTDDLTILGQTISGATARQKIDNLMPISMQHPESLKNLPIMIVEVLADDNLSESRKDQLRAAWAALGQNKDFLTFIHAYATSTLFHSTQQRKYFTSFERAFLIANKFNINNIEAYFSNDSFNGRAGREVDNVMEGDNAGEIFTPLHNVFGGQNSSEASDSAVAFEKNYNLAATQHNYQFSNNLPVKCDSCDQGSAWQKDWRDVIPAANNGYSANHVARWLWRHVFGSLDNYTELERAHLVAILGSHRSSLSPNNYDLDDSYVFHDLNFVLCLRNDRIDDNETENSVETMLDYPNWRNYCRHGDDGHEDYSPSEMAALSLAFNGNDLVNNTADPYPFLRSAVEQLAQRQMDFGSTNDIVRRRANERVHAALAFIFAGPFIFAEGQ